MNLEIKTIDLNGKAYLCDCDSNKIYRMEKAGSEIQPVDEKDFDNNRMSAPIIHSILYAGRTFKKLKDAQRFISKTTYEYRIRELGAQWKSEQDKYIKERINENIDDYLVKIKKLG